MHLNCCETSTIFVHGIVQLAFFETFYANESIESNPWKLLSCTSRDRREIVNDRET